MYLSRSGMRMQCTLPDQGNFPRPSSAPLRRLWRSCLSLRNFTQRYSLRGAFRQWWFQFALSAVLIAGIIRIEVLGIKVIVIWYDDPAFVPSVAPTNDVAPQDVLMTAITGTSARYEV